MAIPSIYINLEDDVSKIVSRFKHNPAKEAILVCPKRCFLFNDSINLRLLKKQMDLLGKKIFILTMDERGQLYAKEAGFELKFLPKSTNSGAMSDIKRSKTNSVPTELAPKTETNPITSAVNEIKYIAKKITETVSPTVLPTSSATTVKTASIKTKEQKPLPKVNVVDSFFPSELEQQYKEKPLKRNTQKVITGFVAISLIVILLLVFVVLPKATVVIYAKTEPVTRDMEISMGINVPELDISKLQIPATKFDETLTLSDKFQSQGKKQVGNKATGTIKIYNFNKTSLNLKSSTTVLTVGSKTYRLVNDVSGLKVTKYSNAKTKEVDINSLGDSIEIEATDGGENFNLPAGTRMEITNQVFGSKPDLLYAKTDSELNGGTTRYISLISQDDVTNARNLLSQRAFTEIQNKLKQSGLAIPEKSYSFEVSQFSTDNQVGSQSPSFQASIQIKTSGIAFKSAHLKKLISERIKQTLSTNKTLQEKNPDSTIIKVKTYDSVNQVATLVVHYEGKAMYELNLSNVEKELVGKSQNDAYEILRSKAEIDKVEITLAPSWQKNFPFFANKIKVETAKNTEENQ